MKIIQNKVEINYRVRSPHHKKNSQERPVEPINMMSFNENKVQMMTFSV